MDQLYKQRDPRVTVMDNVADDLEFANNNIRQSDGTAGLTINRSVALAFTSKVMLFEGTWQKYRENNTAKATEYLKIAKDAAARLCQVTNIVLRQTSRI